MKQRTRYPALLAAAVIACGLTGCATAPSTREYQDEQTAATVTVAGRGLVFAEALTAYAVNARNYLSLVPVEINRGGTKVLYWYGYSWSTIDKHFGHEPPTEYFLEADGRQIKLTFQDTSLRDLGIGAAPVAPPVGDARAIVAVANRADMRLVSGAKELNALGMRNGTPERYDLWEDGRASIEGFLNGDYVGR